jgi:hypothetical protein
MATIDIVDYYLGAILPSPESVRIDVSSISLPSLTKLGLLPFLRHSHGKKNFLFSSVMSSKLSPALPNLVSYPNFVLSLSSPNMATLKHPPPCSSAATLTPPPSPLS